MACFLRCIFAQLFCVNMTIITLHVTPLSRCVLLHEYGPEPIQLPKKDIVLDYIRSSTVYPNGYQPRTLSWLSATIDVAVPEKLASLAAQRNSNVGISLFNFHREVMLRYVEALTSVGYSASGAIEAFYNKYGLTEWDYSTEAAYRRWVDYKRESGKKSPVGVFRKRDAPITLCNEQLLEKCEAVLGAYDKAVKRIGTRLPSQLRYYVLYRYGQLTLNRVGIINQTSTSAVHRGVLAVEQRLRDDRLLYSLMRENFAKQCP